MYVYKTPHLPMTRSDLRCAQVGKQEQAVAGASSVSSATMAKVSAAVAGAPDDT
jgi:hypothetical protein